ncbi:MAG: hypothetical protein QGG71_10195 [Pirellulaceae bacterium]|nr:hypothetical protein [Pirellulaceae bacterium]
MLRFSIPLVLILSTNAFAQTVRDPDETEEVWSCDFEEEADTNYDRWPDGWTRRRGRGYPTYIKVEIAEDESFAAQGKRCLRMDLDGGAVSVYSPFTEVSPLLSYTLSGFLKTSGLVHDNASMEVIFYDENRKVIESFKSAQFRNLPDWREVLIGPVTLENPRVRWASIALHLSPSERADIVGSASFDKISLGRLPRMSLSTNSEHNIYSPQENVEVTCQLSGYTGYEPRLRFELRDVQGRVLDSHEENLHATATAAPPKAAVGPPKATARNNLETSDDHHGGSLATASWQPPIQKNGFYQVRVSVHGQRGLTRTVNLVVVDPMRERVHGEFGWSLPDGDKKLPLKTLASLLGHVGINWIKFPIWYNDDQRAERLAWFAERVSVDNIEMVGVLDQPPERIHDLFGEGGKIPIASVFVTREVWIPAIDAVMTRLSLKVRWWQLGDDGDFSFVNYPQLENKLNEIRDGFHRFGQEINIGMTWRSIDEETFSETPPLTFLSYTANPPLTDNELKEYLADDQNERLQRWVILEPLDRDTYSLETQTRDLVKRMLAAKIGKADGIFVPRPFDPTHGLMEPDGTPGALLLPWRMTADMLAGASYLGTISLPNRSSNYMFERDGEAVMVIWNSSPTQETIYLGEKVQQIDLWGNKIEPKVVTDRDGFIQQIVQVGTLPTFITGVNANIAKWRMSLEFKTKELESVFGQRQRVAYHFRNSIPGVGGSVSVITPPAWIVDAPKTQFELSANELREEHMDVQLGTNSNIGSRRIRLDFNLSADGGYRFSVYREIRIGLGDIELELESHLDEHGDLVVDQHLTNKTDRLVSFNCLLFVPDRRRVRRQVFNLGRGRQTTRFLIPDGKELIGLTLGLRAEEIGGARVLNSHIVAEE